MEKAFRAVVLLAVILSGGVALACDQKGLCEDVSSSLHGQVITEGIVITWSTDEEAQSAVSGYFLWRYNCEEPGSCASLVAMINHAGECETEHDYSYQDQPAPPLEQWSYFIEVRPPSGSVACTHYVTPE